MGGTPFQVLLSDHINIKKRWKGYFENLLNEENPRAVFSDVVIIEENEERKSNETRLNTSGSVDQPAGRHD